MILKKKLRKIIMAAAMTTILGVCPVATAAASTGDVNVNGTQTFAIQPRGQNYIKATTSPTGEIQLSRLALKKGASVNISVWSGSRYDQYRAGLIRCSNITREYVDSYDGMASYTFDIEYDGNYIVYFTAENGKGGSDLTIEGYVTVNY